MQTAVKVQITKTKCAFCQRVLTDAESIARGTGPECAGKLAQQLAALDAGRAIEKSLGDYSLLTKGAHLRTLERLEARWTGEAKPVPAALQRDLHAARATYARRVEYLASQGMLSIPLLEEAPLEEAIPAAPTEATMEAMATADVEPVILRRLLRTGSQPEAMPLSEAALWIQGESFAAATSRRVMKAILRHLRAGQVYQNWHAAYWAAPAL